MATPFIEEVKRYNETDGKFLANGDKQLLDRWTAHDRAQEIWDKIQGSSLKHNEWHVYSRHFIGTVLAGRIFADEAIKIRAEDSELRSQIKNLVKKALKANLSPADLANILERIAGLLRALPAPPAFVNLARMSRSNRAGSRSRTVFMQIVGNFVKDMCGQPLDEVVRVLTEIAFDGRDITINQVRSARDQPKGRRLKR